MPPLRPTPLTHFARLSRPLPSPLSPYSTNPGATQYSPYSHYVPTTALRLRCARALRARGNHSPRTRSVETQQHFGPRGRCKYHHGLQGGRAEAPHWQGDGDGSRARTGQMPHVQT